MIRRFWFRLVDKLALRELTRREPHLRHGYKNGFLDGYYEAKKGTRPEQVAGAAEYEWRKFITDLRSSFTREGSDDA